MAIFMKYDGIDGESTVRGRTGYVELHSLSFSASRATAAAKAGERGDSGVHVQEIVVTKMADRTTAQFFAECLRGYFDKTVKIEFITTGPNNKPITYLTYNLTECGITTYQMSGSGGEGHPTESLSLNYKQIEVISVDMGDGRNAVPFTASHSVDTGTTT